jgi:hypothetical protein
MPLGIRIGESSLADKERGSRESAIEHLPALDAFRTIPHVCSSSGLFV